MISPFHFLVIMVSIILGFFLSITIWLFCCKKKPTYNGAYFPSESPLPTTSDNLGRTQGQQLHKVDSNADSLVEYDYYNDRRDQIDWNKQGFLATDYMQTLYNNFSIL